MRHAHLAGSKDPLMHRLVPTLVGKMGEAFPELRRANALITETLKLEETRFKQTLERGLKLLDEETASMEQGGTLDGGVAFKLYDTYGFPLDLTQDALRSKGMSVETDGFNAAMKKQKELARAAWAGSGDSAEESVWFDLREEVGASEFLGYDTEQAEGQVVAIVRDGKPVRDANDGDDVAVILNQTPFYAESGGQMGDAGIIYTADGGKVTVSDTKKRVGDLHVHMGKVSHGTIRVGQAAQLSVDGTRRGQLRANHSATHLLHEALRRRLGDHITQKGSLVAPDRLRFDISQPVGLKADEIQTVERDVNNQVRANADVVTRLMTPDEAIEQGAMALFGEKYGEEVRVVSMGDDQGRNFSTELCGGTHVRRTGDIGAFKIISEGAVAAGVRRIEAVTGQAALDYLTEQEGRLSAVASTLKVAPSDVPARVVSLIEERRKLERELAEARKALATGGSGGAAKPEAEEINGVKFTSRVLEGMPPKELKGMADELKKQLGSGVVVVISGNEGKASIVVAVTPDMTDKVSAVDLVRVGSEALGGKGGGGRPDMAQAGGPDASKADAAVDAIKAHIAG